jgi:hypothetical protein
MTQHCLSLEVTSTGVDNAMQTPSNIALAKYYRMRTSTMSVHRQNSDSAVQWLDTNPCIPGSCIGGVRQLYHTLIFAWLIFVLGYDKKNNLSWSDYISEADMQRLHLKLGHT